VTSFVLLATFLTAVVDPSSARAVARRNETLLAEGEAALDAADASTALARALAIDSGDRRLARARHRLLLGRARAALGLADEAVIDLRAGRDALASDDLVRGRVGREIARVERARGAFDACADELFALAVAGPLDDDDALLQASCLRGTTRRALAHDALAGRQSPDVRALRAALLLEDGLPLLAREDVEHLRDRLAARDLLAFAGSFRAAGDGAFAVDLIETAAMRFPDDVEVARALATIGDGGGRLVRAAWVTTGLAERLRTAGRTTSSWNALLADEGPARLRGRLALLVDAQAWDRVRALAPRLRAAGVVDDDIGYALAWASLVAGDLEDADASLDGATTASGFSRAAELRAVIAACRAARETGKTDEQERRCPR
jgi:hypothetical protein